MSGFVEEIVDEEVIPNQEEGKEPSNLADLVGEETEDKVEEEEEQVEEVTREDFVREMLGEDLDEEIFEEYMDVADKYGLTNDQLSKYNEIASDVAKNSEAKQEEVDQATDAAMQSELQKLSPEERGEVKDVFDYWDGALPESMKPVFDTMFQTAEGFRMAKMMMDSNSQTLPNLDGKGEQVIEFGQEEYGQMSDAIRKATEDMDFDQARLLKQKMKSEIVKRGTPEIKKDLAHWLNK